MLICNSPNVNICFFHKVTHLLNKPSMITLSDFPFTAPTGAPENVIPSENSDLL